MKVENIKLQLITCNLLKRDSKTHRETEIHFIKKKQNGTKLQFADTAGKTIPGIKRHPLQKIPDVVHVAKLFTGKPVV